MKGILFASPGLQLNLLMMMKLIWILLVIATTVKAQDGENEIKRLSAQFSQNYLQKNFRAMADAYTEDALVLSPGRDLIQGREKIYEFWSASTTTYTVHRSVSEKIIFSGDEAHDYGYFFTQSQNADGTTNPLTSAKYYIIWKKENGVWKMKMDMWNSRDRNWKP